MRGPTAPIEQQDMDQLIRTVKELRTAFDAFAGTMERTTGADCAVDPVVGAQHSPSTRDKDSAALSTLRTSLRALRDKMAAESDLIAVMSDQDNNNAQVAARRLREFAAELDALIGNTPQEPT